MFHRHLILGFLIFSGAASVLFYSLSSDSDSDASFPITDPEMAPEPIRASVMRGFYIMLETKKFLPEYAGDRISCTNCHFSAGNNLGGKNGGISLVGVTAKYPINLGDNRVYTLAERVNACFENSLNGRALPLESPHMIDILNYLTWISEGITDPGKAPWLGLKKIASAHVPNPENGGEKYQVYCAMCHGLNGQGQQRKLNLSYPPLWGPHSFNDAAGFNKIDMLAAFLLDNMPYEDASLKPEEALDIAAFLVEQPRPKKQK